MKIIHRCALLAAGLVLGLLSTSAHAAEGKRPNILFIFADDWGRQAGAYAQIDGPGTINDIAQTPNFDRLSSEGVLYRNAFVNAPSCTPCRSALLSGQHFWRTGRGAILQGAVWDSSIPSYPLLLHEAGYHIGKTYKVWGPGTPNDAPYGGQKFAYQKAGGRMNRFSQVVTREVAQGKPLDVAKREVLDEVRANFRDFLAQRAADQPFCYWFGPTNTHRRWIKGSGQALWGIDPDALQGKMPPFLPDVSAVREDLADYFGEIAALDAAIGVLLEELRKTGEYDETLIVVSGDHGPPGFPHGKCNLYDFGTRVALAIAGPGVKGGHVVDDFVSLIDLAPTFLEAAQVPKPEVMTGGSLWPVLKAPDLGGNPFRDHAVTGRERHVEIAREGYLPYPQRALRMNDYLFIINFRPERYPLGEPYRLDGDQVPTTEELTSNTMVTLPDEDAGPTKAWLVEHRHDPKWKSYFDHAYGLRPREELYDLKRDPHQMHNVADDPAYAVVVDKLRERLLGVLQHTGDPRLENDGEFFETPPLAGPLPDDVPHPVRKR